MLPVGNPEMQLMLLLLLLLSLLLHLMRRTENNVICAMPLPLTHTYIFIIKLTVACAVALSLSLTQTAQLQIKLILRKLLPTECGCAIVLFALTNCFCFSAGALELGSSSLRVWGGMSSVVFSSSDCSLWLSGTLYDDFLQWLCVAFVILLLLLCGNWFVHFMSRFCYWH